MDAEVFIPSEYSEKLVWLESYKAAMPLSVRQRLPGKSYKGRTILRSAIAGKKPGVHV